MTTRLQGLIFDLDGVIVDSHHAHREAWRTLLGSLGRVVTEQELGFVVEGRKRQEIMRFFLGELTSEQQREYGSRKEKLFWQAADALKTVPGVVEFISAAAKNGIPMAVATSASRDRARAILVRFNLACCFAAVVTGDDVAQGKPDPAIFRRAAGELQIAAGNLAVLEDAMAGVQAAKSAGMKAVAIAANGRRALLESAGADLIIEDFTRIQIGDIQELFGSPGG